MNVFESLFLFYRMKKAYTAPPSSLINQGSFSSHNLQPSFPFFIVTSGFFTTLHYPTFKISLTPNEIRATPRKQLPDAHTLIKANPMRCSTLTSHRTMN
jgi:hypothetical protein